MRRTLSDRFGPGATPSLRIPIGRAGTAVQARLERWARPHRTWLSISFSSPSVQFRILPRADFRSSHAPSKDSIGPRLHLEITDVEYEIVGIVRLVAAVAAGWRRTAEARRWREQAEAPPAGARVCSRRVVCRRQFVRRDGRRRITDARAGGSNRQPRLAAGDELAGLGERHADGGGGPGVSPARLRSLWRSPDRDALHLESRGRSPSTACSSGRGGT